MMQYKKASLEEVFLELTEAAKKGTEKQKYPRRLRKSGMKKEQVAEEEDRDESSL